MTAQKTIQKNVLVIGLGLLGGSFALDLKAMGGLHLMGFDKNKNNAHTAQKLGFVDEIVENIADAVSKVAIVIVAVPVNFIGAVVSAVLDRVKKNTVVFDVGSVKYDICKHIDNHPKRNRFIAMHPIAGTEFSGPTAALKGLFKDKVNIICDTEKTDATALKMVVTLCEKMGMKNIFMKSKAHDKHIAYVSHLSHVSSFMLGKTVLEIEKKATNIFNMAGSGFASTVRLAKSSPEMWVPIFLQNKKNVLKSLDEYIKNLKSFRAMIVDENQQALSKSMQEIHRIKPILKGILNES